MHPAVLDGVTNREERNGGAYSNTKRLTISNTKMLFDTRSDRSMISLSLAGQRRMNLHKEIDSRVSGLVITDQNGTFQRTRF